jgi:hypothetical protein
VVSDEIMKDASEPSHLLDSHVRAVARLLPFRVDLAADMGYTGTLFIDLGHRGSPDDPPDTASIDGEFEPVVWMFDVEGGRETVPSNLGPNSDPGTVADWIVAQAHHFASPAVNTPRMSSTDAMPRSEASIPPRSLLELEPPEEIDAAHRGRFAE